MFNEDEDWNDEEDGKLLSKVVLKNKQKNNSSSKDVKSKAVGKKSLLRTLQTLGSVPEWKNDSGQQDSESETEAAASHSKKKKKRRKKRKHAEESEEQQENGDETMREEKHVPTKKKQKKDNTCGPTKAKSMSAGEGQNKETTNSAQANVNKPGTAEKISRQQWKNKMKNKRKCKNKFRQNKPDEEANTAKSSDEQKAKEVVRTDSCSNSNSQTTAQKKKTTRALKGKTEAVFSPTTEEKQQTNKEKKTKSDCSALKAAEMKSTDSQQQQSPTKTQKPELSRQQNLKRQKLLKILQNQQTGHQESSAERKDEPAVPPAEVEQSRSDSLRSRMEQRLESARFRYINEVLYSTSSGEARRMFRQDPEAFWVYHKGYTAQVQRWPANPVDAIISYIHTKPSSQVVADFGCGDCKIAHSVKNRVHSFDLAATCELVTVCDMANVPLADHSVDIAVFCLSLMGTNLVDFLAEANRVLKMGGCLKIAEVASRFDNVRSFINTLSSLGFKMVSKDTENSHFYSFEFVKTGNVPENTQKLGLQLKPCVYKKR
ncbi:ribosomal RNA-processing protein 8 [Parambassis ranga]|uniref:Ribosomal RNA-processing protein 8 n=1 Tax=Parambassis ranga TaxID=210632 RepID=A0A6P7JF83_9TELE|nr:ribosomal RNA-processing protein 8 [Parambassis ranga]